VFEWARWSRRALLVAGAITLIGGGVSLFGQPAREILYHMDPPRTICAAHGCTSVYRLEVGNSGHEPQDQVFVRLRRDVVDRALLPVWVRDFGKIDRRVEVRDEGEVRRYALGRVEPRVRVEVTVILQAPSEAAREPWERVLAGVEAPGARLATGHAAWTMVLRAWFAILSLF
jgi:hypothetical protein